VLHPRTIQILPVRKGSGSSGSSPLRSILPDPGQNAGGAFPGPPVLPPGQACPVTRRIRRRRIHLSWRSMIDLRWYDMIDL
jgi:hypothetical protein